MPIRTVSSKTLFGLLLLAVCSSAQTVTTTLPAGNNPNAIAVNPLTNKIYVANKGDSVTVIDGATNTTTTVVDPNANNPVSVAVNTLTNQIYVANYLSNNVTVINGATNDTPATYATTVPVGANPINLAVNPITNKIYVANNADYALLGNTATPGSITVIDANNNYATTTVSPYPWLGPVNVAVDQITNVIYVVNQGSNNVTVIDGCTNNTTTVSVPSAPTALAVNPVTNQIYALISGGVSVINGASRGGNCTGGTYTPAQPQPLTTVNVAGAADLSVNTVTDQVYVTQGNALTVINGNTCNSMGCATTLVPVSDTQALTQVALNPITNEIYAVDRQNSNVAVVDGATNTWRATLTNPNVQFSSGITVNPVTNKIYVAYYDSDNVSVIDGATNSITTVSGIPTPFAVGVNPVTNLIYVATRYSGEIAVIDGTAMSTVATLQVGGEPFSVAVNPITNNVYVANEINNNVSVIQGTSIIATVPAGVRPVDAAVNPVTNQVYVVNQASNNVTVINGATNTCPSPGGCVTIPVGAGPTAVAVNPATNKVYVANQFSNNITVIDASNNNSVITVTDPNAIAPQDVAVNPVTNKIYVANYGSNNVTVIDGVTNTTITVADPNASGPDHLAVNPITNKIYVANENSSNVTVIDGATDNIRTLNTVSGNVAIGVNPVTNKIYAVGSSMTVIDGATTSTTTIAGGPWYALAVNPVTNQIDVTSVTGETVDIIAESDVPPFAADAPCPASPAQLTACITPQPNSQVTGPAAPFNFTAPTPSAQPPPNALYYQLATWQGPWQGAANSGANAFTGSVSGLAPGVHILYAYVTDGQDTTGAGANDGGLQSSPLISNITAYVFLDTPPASSPTVVSASPNPASGASPTFTLTYSDSAGGSALQVVAVNFNSTNSTAHSCYVEYAQPSFNPAQTGLYLFNDAGTALLGPLAPGSSGTLSNSQCTINGMGSLVSTSGDDLTLTLSVTASASFVGAKNIWMFAEDYSSSTGWVNEGTWMPPPSIPSVVSASPTPVSGATQTFTLVYSDTADYAALTGVAVLLNSSISPVNACYVYYVPQTSLLYLQNDSGTGATSIKLPSSGMLSNSQCTINGANTSVVASGNTLTLNLAVTASASFQGPKSIYMYARDNLANTGWVNKGSWTPSAAFVPSVVSVSPNPASGAVQNFVLQYADTGSSAALTSVAVRFNTSTSPTSACYVYYAPQTNLLYLQNDSGTGPTAPPITPGSGTLSNSQCTINGANTSVTPSGNNLTLNLAVTASASFQGPKNIYMYAADTSSANTGWIYEGAWTPSAPFVPSVVSVNPNPASGVAQNFVLQYSDTGGSGAITSIVVLFNSTLSPKNACYVYYVPQTGLLYLQNDSSVGATSLKLPSSGTLSNSQCTINGTNTSVTSSGNNLTLNLAVTASGSFEGPKNIYMYAADDSSANTGWIDEGSWTPSPSFVPSVVLVSPNPASGTSQIFTLEYSDTGGSAALTTVAVLFNTVISTKHACYVYYAPQSNLLYLENDSGTGASSITPGSGTLSNSQCTIDGSETSVTISAGNLTLNLAVSAAEGQQNIYMYAADDSSATTGWIKKGTWTP